MGGGHELSAVIVTYNSAAVIEACGRSLRRWLPDAEIIVVDNGSSDDTVARSESLGGVRLLADGVNAGFGRACNQGVAAAAGRHVLLLNPDIELIDLDTQALGTELARRPFGLAAPIIEDGVGGGSLRSHWTRDLLHHALDPLIPRELPPVPRLLPRPRHWWPAGAVLLVDREEFLGLGGFDPRFFLYYEDRDLARRYAGAGLPIRRLECARARHVRGTSSVGELAASPVRQGWSYLSWVEYLAKWERPATATRAVRTARRLGAAVDRGLALLERTGPAAGRAARKRRELADIESFIRDRCDDPVDGGFCPRAREIAALR